jgi:hypothetical protein
MRGPRRAAPESRSHRPSRSGEAAHAAADRDLDLAAGAFAPSTTTEPVRETLREDITDD